MVAAKTWPRRLCSRIGNRPFSASKIRMQLAHEVGSTENGLSYNQKRVSYTFDSNKTLMDALKNQMCGLGVAEI